MQESKHASVDLAAPDAQRALRAFSDGTSVGSEQHAHGALPPLEPHPIYGYAKGEPCPICGSSVRVSDLGGWEVLCNANCGMTFELPDDRSNDLAVTVAAWNRRASCSQVAVPKGMALWQAQWIAMAERTPQPGTECIVWSRGNAQHGPYAFLDTWDEQYECPVSFSTVSVPVGLGWDSTDLESITHWMPLPPAPPSAALPGSAGVQPNDALERLLWLIDNEPPTEATSRSSWVNNWQVAVDQARAAMGSTKGRE